MTGSAESWLPVSVATREVVRAAASGAVADWSALWFSRPHARVSALKPTALEPRDDIDGSGWRVYHTSVAISCAKGSSSRIAGWALDAQLDHLVLKKADRRLLDSFEQTLLEDLARKIELAFGVEPESAGPRGAIKNPFGKLGGVVITLTGDNALPLLAIGIPLKIALPLCRASLGPVERKSAQLTSFAHALGCADMAIEATLGHAEISVADLRGLAAGDVLVLTRALNDAVQVSLSGSDAAFAKGKLIDLDGQIAIALEA